MRQATICAAITNKRVVQFNYDSSKAPGSRVVEPYMIAFNQRNNLILSGWFLQGESASEEGPGWKEYLLDKISSLSVLEETFSPPRPGYKPDGGKIFRNVQCAV
jgi:predicted DNA-binding transcriptional regulator YafY